MLQYDRRELGKFLTVCRLKVGKTQAQVATALGYSSAQFVSNIERGVSVAPLEVISKMIRLYKASPEKVVQILLDSQAKLILKALKKKN